MNPHPFPYLIIRSNRRTLAIQVSTSGQVTVRAPHTMPESTIDNFLVQKESWILKHLAHATPAPANAPDDVIVHELAHRKEMNHSPAFYAVVASIMPEYKTYEKWLKDNGRTLWQNP